MYLIQNAALSGSAAFCLAALGVVRGSWLFWLCIALLIALGAISSAGALGATLSVEKEWTKAICGDDSAQLAKLNAGIVSSESGVHCKGMLLDREFYGLHNCCS